MGCWHYTTAYSFTEIRRKRLIRRARLHVPKGERAVVWFSRRATWDPTATMGIVVDGKRVRASVAHMIEGHGPLIRLAVSTDVARYTFAQYRQLSRIDPRVADGLVTSAIAIGSDPSEWRVSFHDVPTVEVLAVEIDTTGDDAWRRCGQGAPDGAIHLDEPAARALGIWYVRAEAEGRLRLGKAPEP